MASTDRDVLVSLLHSTGRAGWKRKDNWGKDASLSLWDRVEVDGQGRVVGLHLSLNALEGPIPDQLGGLAKVESLDLSRNKLSGPIPEELGGLAKVENLDLSRNQLSGPIPEELGGLTNVVRLNLSYNQLSGPIPEELGGLAKVKNLDLSRNQLSGPIPEELGGLTNVVRLNLSYNQLSGPIPEKLGGLAKVESLETSHNKLSGPIPEELGGLTNVVGLDLSYNYLSGSVPAQFVKLQQLEQLNVEGNQLGGPVPSPTQLRELHRALVSPSFMFKASERVASDTLERLAATPCLANSYVELPSGVSPADAEGVRSGMPTTAGGMSEHGEGEASRLWKLEPRGGRESRASDNYAINDGDKMAIISDFEGSVVAWSFGTRTEVLRCDDAEVELEVTDLGRTIPALIGVCSSSAEVVGDKQCLLHPIVTCLAQADEKFDPPLRLRFPVGDIEAMESGSDSGTPDEAELAYRAHLESTFSAWTREYSHSAWVPIDGTITEVEGGVFVLEVAVSHFCDFALKQDIHVDDGSVEVVELAKLKRKSRRAHYHFVNLGTENLVVYCWGAPWTQGFLDAFRLKLGVGSSSGSAEVEAKRTLVDVPGTGVYKVDVPGGPLGERRKVGCLVAADGPESLTVAYTTQETVRPLVGSAHELVQVWGRRSMKQKHVMLFGALTGSSRMVSDLKVDNGVNVGELVRTLVG
ncbi:unnamed protein product [Scytosiphon promiscuus]